MTMNMAPVATWSTSDISLLIIMWAIMMAGMMLPSALPIIMLVESINKKRQANGFSYTPTLFFALGYLITWCFYSLIIALLQFALHHLELLNQMMISNNNIFSASLLIIAGSYQFSSYKQHCLHLCRSPLSLIASEWREGILGALSLGIKHGSYCLGCCWFLMALLFIAGVMNLTWILILTLVVLVEKLAPNGERLSKILGVALIFYGISYLV
ncbi:hypothetical protein CXF71_21295 [Colwellia sp. 12G3]|nr:hypothetical protein CXF71_21295 [Colwellia sp. 12G3]